MAENGKLMSLRGYAKARGMALSTLQHHISSGTLMKIDGKIDPDYADVVLRERINHKQSERGRGQRVKHGHSSDTGGSEGSAPEMGIEHWRLQREKMEYRKLELAVLEREGQLVEAEEVHQAQFDLARQLRDSVMSIPSRMAEILAAEGRPIEVEKLLTQELRQALSEIAVESCVETDDLLLETEETT